MMKGHVIQVLRLAALLLVVLTGIILHARTAQADGDVWTSVGPDGGRIETIAVSPAFANDRTVFVGTATGVYKTTDGGTSWSAVNNGIDDRRVLSLAISPSYATDKAVFAGVAGSGGVYKSTDGGLNWRKVYYRAAPYSNVDSIGSLVVSPNYATDQTVFAGKSFYNGSMLLKSTDGGESWSAAGNGISGSSVRSLAISAAFATDRTIFAATPGGVFKSTDGSANWIAVNSGLYHNNVLSVAISSGFATDHTMYAITTIDPYYGGGIFKSTDGGANWSWVEGNYSISNKTVSGCTCLTLSPDYAVDQTVFAGTKDAGLFISRDGGYGFSQVDGMLDKNILTLSASPGYSTDKTAFAGTYANLLKSTDQGAAWSPANNGIKELAFGPFAVSPNYAADQTLITQANNVFKKTTDGGISWSEAPFGKGAYSLAYSPGFASDRTLFAGVMAGGVYKSSDGGATWVPAKSGIDQVSINSLAISPAVAADNTIFAGSLSNGVFKTTNGGGSWSAVSSGINGSGLYIKALALSPGYVTDRTVFAGTNAGVYKSSNGGASWSAFNTGIVNMRITTLVISPGYVTDQTIFAGTEAGVYKSTDGGSSWSAFGSGIGSIAIGALAMSPGYAVDRIMYAGTSGSGVFKSVDGGQSWTSVNSGLVNLDISYLSYTNDRSVFAITSGGLFKMHDSAPSAIISITPASLAFGETLINAPPAVVSFSISNTGDVGLAVSQITITGNDSAMFSVTTGTCSSITPTLPAGTSCSLNIAFAPKARGALSAIMQVTSNDPFKQIVNVSLTGSGKAASPLLVSYQPANGAIAPVTTTVQASFSEPLDPASVTAGSFTLSRADAVSAIAAGEYHSIALKSDGAVMGWGLNANGQTVAPALSGVTAIAAGSGHTVALKGNGTVVAWGLNNNGQATVPEGLSGVTAIAAGVGHTVALKDDGTVVAWGLNNNGQSTVTSGLSGVTAIAAGGSHSLAIKNDGTVVAWGYNGDGASSVPAGLSGVVAVAAGVGHSVALKNNGTVVAWGDGGTYAHFGQSTVPTNLSGVIAIAAGYWHTLVLKNDGTVVAWGRSDYGQTTVPAGLSGVIAIAAGWGHSVALKGDGTVVAWGHNSDGQITVPTAFQQAGSVVSGLLDYDPATLTAIFSPTAPLVTGVTYFAAVAGVRNLNDIPLAVPARWSFTTEDSSLLVTPQAYDFGKAIINSTPVTRTFTISNTGTTNQVVSSIILSGNESGPFRVSPGTCDSLTPTLAPGSVCTVDVDFAPTATGSRSAFLQIIANNTVSILLKGTGALGVDLTITSTGTGSGSINYSTGGSCNGNCRPSIANGAVVTLTPMANSGSVFFNWAGCDSVIGNQCIVTMSSAKNVMATFHVKPTVINYQPSDGSIAPVSATVQITFNTPVNPSSLSFTLSPNRLIKAIAIATGWSHTVALKSDGSVVAWGDNYFGQTTVPAGLTGVTAISAGAYHTVALKSNATLVAWGNDGFRQSWVPPEITGVIAISTGHFHNVALRSNGTVVAWGRGDDGQTTVPEGLSGVTAIAAGGDHSVALKSNGTVVAWGYNGAGQTNVPAGLTGVTTIAAGANHTLALKSNGTVVAWGDGPTPVPADLNGVIAIAGGGNHAVALKSNGTVVAWGNNFYGQTTVPVGLTGVTAIAAGYSYSVALKNDGTAVVWGDVSSVPGIPDDLSYVSGTLTFDPAALTATFTPLLPLLNGVTYNAAVVGVASQPGVPLAAPVDWSFSATNTSLTLILTGDGAGSIQPSPSPGVNCFSGSCSYPYLPGTVVTLTAKPAHGSTFTGWGGDCSGSGQCTLTMNAGRTVTAGFKPSGDTTRPAISGFTMPATATTLTVPVTAFTASDNVGVTGYLITESPMPPSAYIPGWSSNPPNSYTFLAPGNCYAYAWARDAAGNVSVASVAMVNITVTADTDTVAPLISAFILPSGTTLTVPIATFAVTDNVGVGGYLISESGAIPPASDPRWLGAPPASFTFTTYGNKTLHAWAKDAAGNVSARVAATCLLMDPEQQLDTVLTGWPANPAEASPSTFSFTASKGGTTFECSLDGQGYFACASPISFGALANGSHTFSVRAKDGVLYDDTPASCNWTVSIPIARVNLNTFTSITSAYAASSDGHSLELKGLDFREDLVFDRPISITLKGGYDPGYLSTTGTTGIHGTLVISNGTVTVDNITIM